MLLTVFLGKIQCAGVFKICKTIYKNDEYLKCIQSVFDYMRSTWLESDLWTVECWSVFGQTHRTNNNLEGKTYSKQYNKTILKSMCKI